jgi:hypothetical protein
MQRNSYQMLLGSFRFCCNHFILLEFIWRYVFIVFRLLFSTTLSKNQKIIIKSAIHRTKWELNTKNRLYKHKFFAAIRLKIGSQSLFSKGLSCYKKLLLCVRSTCLINFSG